VDFCNVGTGYRDVVLSHHLANGIRVFLTISPITDILFYGIMQILESVAFIHSFVFTYCSPVLG